jgi:hypothetical protein
MAERRAEAEVEVSSAVADATSNGAIFMLALDKEK